MTALVELFIKDKEITWIGRALWDFFKYVTIGLGLIMWLRLFGGLIGVRAVDIPYHPYSSNQFSTCVALEDGTGIRCWLPANDWYPAAGLLAAILAGVVVVYRYKFSKIR